MGETLSTIRVEKPGLMTTIQDQGRPGLLHLAVSRSGAMDLEQLKIANLLVGNDTTDAGLEFTGIGPTIFFPEEICIAFTGAWTCATLVNRDGLSCVITSGRSIIVPAGATVRWSAPVNGFRVWCAIAGGINVPVVLNSRASHLAAELGLSRISQSMDLPIGKESSHRTVVLKQLMSTGRDIALLATRDGQPIGGLTTRWSVPSSVPASWPVIELAALPGRHFNLLNQSEQKRLLSQAWQISSRSNRQGLSLEGDPLNTEGHPNLDSEPVREGTVQLPPAGKPIVLLAEHQSTGGYPRILEVIGAMQAGLAQAGPSARVVFKLVGLQEADDIRLSQVQHMEQLQQAVQARLAGS